MKVVILAGGLGTRLSEETHLKPKPMVEVGGMPIIWHIMKIYSHYGFNDFIICCGYKGYVIKEYFYNYFLHRADVSIDLENNQIKYQKKSAESWKITLVDTGSETMTGGRILRVKDYLSDQFFLTYGDGVADININELMNFHRCHGKLATVTAVKPPSRFGALKIGIGNQVTNFTEKPDFTDTRINGGFFVLSKSILDYIDNDMTIWERQPLEKVASIGQLVAYKHDNFWQPMDTLRDKFYLDGLWNENKAPWKVWN